MQIDYSELNKQHRTSIEQILQRNKLAPLFKVFSADVRGISEEYYSHKPLGDERQEFEYLASLSERLDRNEMIRSLNKRRNELTDVLYAVKNHHDLSGIKSKLRVQSGYLCIVCIIKNEATYIEEWLAFYKLMGVDHIFIFNNNSEDNIQEVLAPYISAGFVTFIEYPGYMAQLPAYRLAAKCLAGRFRWVAFIDADEFVIPQEGSLADYMKTRENCSGIGVNWIVYGHCGHTKRPEGLVSENYWLTYEDRDNLMNLRIKTIVDPAEVLDVDSPHYCILKGGRYAVDENGDEITNRWMYTMGSGCAYTGNNRTRKIRINHYWTKSVEELHEKCHRGYAAGNFNPQFDNIMSRLDYPMIEDRAIAPYIPGIKKIMEEYHV